jgi:hypothetical protein
VPNFMRSSGTSWFAALRTLIKLYNALARLS